MEESFCCKAEMHELTPQDEDVSFMTDSLTEMMTRQLKFQESLGFKVEDMLEEEKVYYAKDQILACLDELHEALAEIGWKPWATSRHFNRDAFVGELIDAWHFLMNLFLVAEVKPHELFSLYVTKNDKNIARQEKGYDGVTDKCPNCKRAYDDDAVNCLPASLYGDNHSLNKPAYCERIHQYMPVTHCPECEAKYGDAGVRCRPADNLSVNPRPAICDQNVME